MYRHPQFEIFAFQILKDNSTGQKILKSGEMYYLLSGYDVHENEITYTSQESCPSNLYNDYLAEEQSNLHVSISAIVGANGSGKSSIVEYILRLLNNLAAAFMLDEDLLNDNHHLRYITGISGQLWYMSDGVPYQLQVDGISVTIWEYVLNTDFRTQYTFTKVKQPIFHTDVSSKPTVDFIGYKQKYARKEKIGQKIANRLFYTYVSNYSLYAYNVRDFRQEWNHNDGGFDRRIDEHGCWLDGLFHKNDGYQTPIVLTPYRVNGNIDVNKEANLSDDRLLALLLCGKGFSLLNGHLEVDELKFSPKDTQYDHQYLRKNCDLRLRARGFRQFRNAIAQAWKQCYNLNFYRTEDNQFRELALNYLACKTLKASFVYTGEYGDFYERLCGVEKWVKDKHKKVIQELVETLSKDDSHITTKIRQTLCFLETGTYYRDDISGYKLKKAIKEYENAQNAIDAYTKDGIRSLVGKPEDLLPPHFLRTNICLKDTNNGSYVEFCHLSSGEKQQIFAISSMLYHLSNIDSVHLDNNNARISYKQVLVILEEIELYYHPALQQDFILYMLNGLRQMEYKNLKNVQVLIVTHSPFVLSDIPSANILALRKGVPEIKTEIKSFGANIHDMLSKSFFLDNGRGKFAEWCIGNILKRLQKATTDKKKDVNNIHYCNIANKIHQDIMNLDEPIIRRILLDRFGVVFPEYKLNVRIRELEEELARLKEEN